MGAKPYDYVLMFKIVVLQRIYHLSDPQAEYQIRDRLSFCDFLGLASGDKVPDEKTIWAFKEELTKKGLFGQLFNEFYAFLEENNLILHEGTMIDGSFVEAPRQHNRRRGLGWNMCSGTWKSAFTECPAEWSALRGTRPTTP